MMIVMKLMIGDDNYGDLGDNNINSNDVDIGE